MFLSWDMAIVMVWRPYWAPSLKIQYCWNWKYDQCISGPWIHYYYYYYKFCSQIEVPEHSNCRLVGKPFGTSHTQPHCPKCYMHHPHGGDMLIWATGSDCKILYLNYRGWGFYQTIPPHSKKCVVPRMTSFLDQCLLMNTMYWHNSFPRSKKLLIISVRGLTIDLYLPPTI